MDFKFNSETTRARTPAQPQEKGRQTGLLVLLRCYWGDSAYLYFFTGLIRPQEQPPAPQPPPQVVKQPLRAVMQRLLKRQKTAEQKGQVSPPPVARQRLPYLRQKPVPKPADSKSLQHLLKTGGKETSPCKAVAKLNGKGCVTPATKKRSL